MSNDRELRIKVVTQGDATGAKNVTAALNETGQAAKSAGKGFEQQGQKIDETGQALSKYKKKHEDSKHEVDKHEISHRALHKIMGMIGKETAPELGEAMTGALYGPIGIAIALGSALEFVGRQFAEASHKAEELRKKEAELTTDVWDRQREAANSAAEAAQTYADKLEAIATQTDKVKQAEELELIVLQTKKQAQIEILKAQEAAEIAKAGGDKVQEEEIKRRYGEKTKAATLEGEEQTIATEQAQLFKRQRDSHQLKANADAAEKNYEQWTNWKGAAQNAAGLKQVTANQAELDQKEKEYNLPNLRERLKLAEVHTGQPGGEGMTVYLRQQI